MYKQESNTYFFTNTECFREGRQYVWMIWTQKEPQGYKGYSSTSFFKANHKIKTKLYILTDFLLFVCDEVPDTVLLQVNLTCLFVKVTFLQSHSPKQRLMKLHWQNNVCSSLTTPVIFTSSLFQHKTGTLKLTQLTGWILSILKGITSQICEHLKLKGCFLFNIILIFLNNVFTVFVSIKFFLASKFWWKVSMKLTSLEQPTSRIKL